MQNARPALLARPAVLALPALLLLAVGCTKSASSAGPPPVPSATTAMTSASAMSTSPSPTVASTTAGCDKPSGLTTKILTKNFALTSAARVHVSHGLVASEESFLFSVAMTPTARAVSGLTVRIADVVKRLPDGAMPLAVPRAGSALNPSDYGLPGSEPDGTYVVYNAVRQVTGRYIGTCDGAAATGTFSMWTTPTSGVVQCDYRKPPKGSAGDVAEREYCSTAAGS